MTTYDSMTMERLAAEHAAVVAAIEAKRKAAEKPKPASVPHSDGAGYSQ